MSRIGKKIIDIGDKTEVTLSGTTLTVKGPKGTLTRTFGPHIDIKVNGKEISLTPKKTSSEIAPLWGTTGSHIVNMLKGVNEMFTKKLILEGIGYKAEVKGADLHLALGFSHPIKLPIPASLKVTSEKGIVTISGINKEEVGQFAAEVRSLKKPEPYKGKGFRYDDEVIKRKQGKKAA